MHDLKFRVWEYHEGMCEVTSLRGNYADMVRAKDGHEFSPEYDGEIMMWTGLKDRHGVEIYERDIVQFGKYTQPYVVSFEFRRWGLVKLETWHNPEYCGGYDRELDYSFPVIVEVISNTYKEKAETH